MTVSELFRNVIPNLDTERTLVFKNQNGEEKFNDILGKMPWWIYNDYRNEKVVMFKIYGATEKQAEYYVIIAKED